MRRTLACLEARIVMPELKTQFLCTLEARLRPASQLGRTPLGQRVIAEVEGGRVTGPRFTGKVLPSGGDWLILGADGCGRIDVRATLELDDGSLVYATYNGRLNVPAEVAPGAFNRATADSVDPSRYYFRTAPTFETSSTKYAWLNHIQAIGVGRITSEGVAYDIFEVL
jgi:hypothetical protein